jgi:hypothetical protein
MLNLSIVSVDTDNVDAVCEDIISQQKSGVSTHAMFMMKFNPEATPPVEKARQQCEKYDLFRSRLDAAGAKHGVLVQATMGHIVIPYEPYPFQPSVSLITGNEHVVTACPLDPEFRKYMRSQMHCLAKHRPSIVMIDDDVGLLYRTTKGCACKLHMAEFNRRAKTSMTREELYAHTQGSSEEDKRYTDIYVQVQHDAIVSFVEQMRAGLDEVDPGIQGIVSGIYTSTYLEFSDDTARAFAGKGNPAIARLNGGPYAKLGTKNFTAPMFRASNIRENAKGKIDRFLAETDTCPQNRYSTSASHLHAHFTASILEGATGAKHWITRLCAHEPSSGKAYRKILSRYAGFYERLSEYTRDFSPFGCRIPISLKQNYGFVESEQPMNLAPWASCVLERMGLPLYFSNDNGGVVFLDNLSVDGFDNEEIEKFLGGTLVLSAIAAKKLAGRGFIDDIGVEVYEWKGETVSGEVYCGSNMSSQYEKKELRACKPNVSWHSTVVHRNQKNGEVKNLFPGVSSVKNTKGGETVVFSGNPDMPFKYYTAFSMLNETRKRQLVNIISKSGNLPLYYPEDAEVYLRAGYLKNGEIMAAVFNLGFDELEEIPLIVDKTVTKVEMLLPDGTRSSCNFLVDNGVLRIMKNAKTLIPVILFIS